MQSSLFNRFCGVLLGAAAGEHCGVTVESPRRSPVLGSTISELQRDRAPTEVSRSGLMRITAESLVACQTFDLVDWQRRLLDQAEPRSPLETLDLSEMAIAMLPLALFFHEDEFKLRQAFQAVSQRLGGQPAVTVGAWVLGFAIAQALQEKLHPPTLIDQILIQLPSVALETAIATYLAQQLDQVQVLVNQRAGLELARMQLVRDAADLVDPKIHQQTTPIALSFYCWLSTPEESQLAVVRSQRLAYRPAVVSSLTGALVGACNGRTGLPVNWCLAVEPAHQSTPPMTSQPPQSGWATLAADLLSVWSGTYDMHRLATQPRQWPAIAAPRVIRPR